MYLYVYVYVYAGCGRPPCCCARRPGTRPARPDPPLCRSSALAEVCGAPSAEPGRHGSKVCHAQSSY